MAKRAIRRRKRRRHDESIEKGRNNNIAQKGKYGKKEGIMMYQRRGCKKQGRVGKWQKKGRRRKEGIKGS